MAPSPSCQDARYGHPSADTVPGRDDGACGYPGTAANNPATNPTNLVAPTGDVTSFTGAQQATSTATTTADQFVAKHFPTRWFTSLTGQRAQTASPTPPTGAQRAAPIDGRPRRRAATNCDANHVANLDDPTNGLVARPDLPTNQVPAFSWITPEQLQRRPRRHLPGQQPLGRVQRQRHPELRDRHGLPPTTPRPPRRRTTPAGCTPRTCSSSTTSR